MEQDTEVHDMVEFSHFHCQIRSAGGRSLQHIYQSERQVLWTEQIHLYLNSDTDIINLSFYTTEMNVNKTVIIPGLVIDVFVRGRITCNTYNITNVCVTCFHESKSSLQNALVNQVIYCHTFKLFQ